MTANGSARDVTWPTGAPVVRTTLRPSRGWAAIDVRELLRFKDLLIVLAGRDLKLRYRQTVLGVSWVLLQPLLAAGLFNFVFGVVAGLRAEGVPYFVFSFAGLLAWNVFGSTLSKVSLSLVGNAYIVGKVYFPRLILPLSTVLSTLIDLSVGLALMAVLLVVYQVWPGWSILLLPVWVALLLLLSVGAGLIAAALTVGYRDVQYILPVVVPFLLYASPVAYQVGHLPVVYRRAFYLANPLASLIEGFRWSLLGYAPPPWAFAVSSAATATVLFLVGAAIFRRMERRVADVI